VGLTKHRLKNRQFVVEACCRYMSCVTFGWVRQLL